MANTNAKTSFLSSFESECRVAYYTQSISNKVEVEPLDCSFVASSNHRALDTVLDIISNSSSKHTLDCHSDAISLTLLCISPNDKVIAPEGELSVRYYMENIKCALESFATEVDSSTLKSNEDARILMEDFQIQTSSNDELSFCSIEKIDVRVESTNRANDHEPRQNIRNNDHENPTYNHESDSNDCATANTSLFSESSNSNTNSLNTSTKPAVDLIFPPSFSQRPSATSNNICFSKTEAFADIDDENALLIGKPLEEEIVNSKFSGNLNLNSLNNFPKMENTGGSLINSRSESHNTDDHDDLIIISSASDMIEIIKNDPLSYEESMEFDDNILESPLAISIEVVNQITEAQQTIQISKNDDPIQVGQLVDPVLLDENEKSPNPSSQFEKETVIHDPINSSLANSLKSDSPVDLEVTDYLKDLTLNEAVATKSDEKFENVDPETSSNASGKESSVSVSTRPASYVNLIKNKLGCSLM